jgi:hypothetical protein
MIRRCTKPEHPSYKDYGAKGITVCDRWLKFENFYADMGERPEGTTLDRRETDGNYEPGNCKWSTRKEQDSNRSTSRIFTVGDKTQTMRDWARESDIPYSTLRYRLDRGLTIQQALNIC